MFNRVLVPLNPYDLKNSVGILPHIASMSRNLDTRVVLAAVIDPEELDLPDFPREHGDEHMEHRIPPGTEGILMGAPTSQAMPVPGEEEASQPAHDQPAAPNTTQIIENLRFESNRRLNKIAMEMRKEGIETAFVTSVASGTSEEILRLAGETGCDLIALATHDRNLLGQAIKGSVTNEVIRDSRLPVIAITPEKSDVRAGQRARLSGVLVPLDGSAFSEAVLPYVEELARQLHLEVNLVRVVEIARVHPEAGGMTTSASQDTARIYSEMEDEASHYLRQIAQRLHSKGVQASWEVLSGTTPGSVTSLAESRPGSLIALASHGRSGLNRLVFGSMAEQLLRATGDPILIIPPRVAEQSTGVTKDWTA